MSTSSQSHTPFSTTRWSVVMQRAEGNPGAALTELAERYGYPVYAYVRRCGHAPAEAHAIMRAYLAHLVQPLRSSGKRPSHGHFRRYLLDELNAFLCADWRRSAAAQAPAAAGAADEFEQRYRREIGTAAAPEAAYQQSFALEVLARALARLRAEAEQSGHRDMFEAMQPFLAREPVPGEIDAMARTLGARPLGLMVALKRLRQRFRELAGQELADTVTSAEDLASEQSALHDLLIARRSDA